MPSIAGIDYRLPYFYGIERENKYAISDSWYCINPREQFKPHHKHAIDRASSQASRKNMIATT